MIKIKFFGLFSVYLFTHSKFTDKEAMQMYKALAPLGYISNDCYEAPETFTEFKDSLKGENPWHRVYVYKIFKEQRLARS